MKTLMDLWNQANEQAIAKANLVAQARLEGLEAFPGDDFLLEVAEEWQEIVTRERRVFLKAALKSDI